MSPSHIAALIDQTILKPDALRAEIERVCSEALAYKFASVCVNPCWVALVAGLLADSTVAVCSVIAFPFGAAAPSAKTAESEIAIHDGARELDMVLNMGALLSGDFALVRDDIGGVVFAAHERAATVKVILETALLTEAQIVTACHIAQDAGADFVKTSTGFAQTSPGRSGATIATVELMRRTVGPTLGVKASGGIRTLEDLEKMVAAGATRIGTSSGVRIVDAARA